MKIFHPLSKWLVLIGMLAGMSTANAALLNLTLQDTPDILVLLNDVAYDATTDVLTASGTAWNLDDDGTTEAITGGTFSLSATIDSGGNLLAGGTMNVGGTIASLGYNSGSLLTGNLTAFGFPGGGGDPLEFLFDVTGGDAASLYGGIGSSVGIILGNTGFAGDFTSDFQNAPFEGTADIAPPVPVPAAMWLFISGLLGLVGFGKTRSKQG